MARFASQTHVVNWQPLDIVSTEVIYENGKEHYRKLPSTGSLPRKRLRNWAAPGPPASLAPCWWMSFHPPPQRISGFAAAPGLPTARLTSSTSTWTMSIPTGTSRGRRNTSCPPIEDTIWIDKETGRVLRIEMQAYHIPGGVSLRQSGIRHRLRIRTHRRGPRVPAARAR